MVISNVGKGTSAELLRAQNSSKDGQIDKLTDADNADVSSTSVMARLIDTSLDTVAEHPSVPSG